LSRCSPSHGRRLVRYGISRMLRAEVRRLRDTGDFSVHIHFPGCGMPAVPFFHPFAYPSMFAPTQEAGQLSLHRVRFVISVSDSDRQDGAKCDGDTRKLRVEEAKIIRADSCHFGDSHAGSAFSGLSLPERLDEGVLFKVLPHGLGKGPGS